MLWQANSIEETPSPPGSETSFGLNGVDIPVTGLVVAVLVLVLALVLASMFAIVIRLLRQRRRPSSPDNELCDVRVSDLPVVGPPAGNPRLEFYGTKIRLAVVVLAPVGRNGVIPAAQLLPKLWESLLPGLGEIIELHRPLIRFWPAQLSSQGFTQLFFHHLALPGDRGRGTPWCSAAGKFDWMGQQFLVGLVGCGTAPNGLGQVTIQHQGLWLDALRVRE